MNRQALGALAAAVFVVAGVGAAAVRTATDGGSAALRGTVTVKAATTVTTCDALPGFDDVRAGTVVILSDASGVALSSAELAPGHVVDGGVACRFPFELDDVGDAGVVRLAVGSRQGLTLTAAQLEATGHRVDLRLGAPTP